MLHRGQRLRTKQASQNKFRTGSVATGRILKFLKDFGFAWSVLPLSLSPGATVPGSDFVTNRMKSRSKCISTAGRWVLEQLIGLRPDFESGKRQSIPYPVRIGIYNNKKFSGDCPKATPPNLDPLMLKCSRSNRRRIPGEIRDPEDKLDYDANYNQQCPDHHDVFDV